MDKKKSLFLCAKIVSVVCALFVVSNCLRGDYLTGAVLAAAAMAMLLPVFLGSGRIPLDPLCTFFCVGLDVMVFIVALIGGTLIPSIAIFICAGSISAVFFETKLVKTSFIACNALFLASLPLYYLRYKELPVDVFTIVEAFMGMVVCSILIYRCVYNGVSYLNKAAEKDEESQRLLATVNRQIEAEKETAKQQQYTLSRVDEASANITAEAGRLADEADSLAAGASEQTSLINELSVSSEEILHRVRDIEEYSRIMRDESEEMRSNVARGSEKMGDMLKAMDDIHDRSLAIKKIIKAIDDIAFQTNLLALNAAVEAARAGAAGRGFSVVADEVRNLAAKSSSAAKNTTELISTCLHAIANGSSIAGETAKTLSRIQNSVDEVSAKTEHITGMSEEQSGMVAEINGKMQQVATVAQMSMQAAERTANTGKTLQRNADVLRELSTQR